MAHKTADTRLKETIQGLTEQVKTSMIQIEDLKKAVANLQDTNNQTAMQLDSLGADLKKGLTDIKVQTDLITPAITPNP